MNEIDFNNKIKRYNERIFAFWIFIIMIGMIMCLLSCTTDTKYARVHQYKECNNLKCDSCKYWYVIFIKANPGQSYCMSSSKMITDFNKTRFYKMDTLPFTKELTSEMEELTINMNVLPYDVQSKLESTDISSIPNKIEVNENDNNFASDLANDISMGVY